jgi:hypothetical protein
VHSSNKNELSVFKDSSLPVLKLRRRIERIESDEHPNISKYSRLFMSKMPRLAWNTSKIVNGYLENIDVNNCLIENIIELYK